MALRIGTCSWKYPSWQGLVYSRGKGINYLEEYSRHFNTVEIDQWFWSLHGPGSVTLPERHVAEEYARSVPGGFTFSVKIPNSITLTHFYSRSKTDPPTVNPHFLSHALFLKFLERLEPMHSRLGPLMFQFAYLNKQKMTSQDRFQEQLGDFLWQLPGGFTFAVEIRNPNYLNTGYFRFLRQNNAIPVFLQGYYMPPVDRVIDDHRKEIESPAVIRLHGPDRKKIEEKTGGCWNTLAEPRDEELDRIVKMIRSLETRDSDLYVNVNNHYEGSAPLTIQRILERLSRND
jgi:uncharacterized protein YecE (DUF72 family)